MLVPHILFILVRGEDSQWVPPKYQSS
jgi:hypothetical protein